jgi:hypothetical protein
VADNIKHLVEGSVEVFVWEHLKLYFNPKSGTLSFAGELKSIMDTNMFAQLLHRAASAQRKLLTREDDAD